MIWPFPYFFQLTDVCRNNDKILPKPMPFMEDNGGDLIGNY